MKNKASDFRGEHVFDSGVCFVHFFGARRSGNHAVIHWLMRGIGMSSKATHVNSVNSRPQPHKEIGNIVKMLAANNPETVIISYEDFPYSDRIHQEHHSTFRSPNDADVILLRSFPNMMASRIMTLRKPPNPGDQSIRDISLPVARDVWLEHARHVANVSGTDASIKHILYDEWCDSRGYRDAKGEEFGFKNRDLGLDFVPSNGNGSSFDGRYYQGRGQDMDTRNRWRILGNSAVRDEYNGLVTEEVVRLNQQIFGDAVSVRVPDS